MKKKPNTDKLLELVKLLNTDEFQSTAKLAEQLGVSTRMVYNYLNVLNEQGFDVEKQVVRYRLDRNSAFFKTIDELIPLNIQEAEYICGMMPSVNEDGNLSQSIKRKLTRYYGLTDQGMIPVDKTQERKVRQLKDAIKRQRQVVLKGYSSPSSHSVKDRLVEPFYLFNNDEDVRCYELSTHMNKTFKLARIESVEIQRTRWTEELKHKRMYTDIFAFSGDKLYIIELVLGQLARNLLIEEYPQTARNIIQIGEGRWQAILNVTSYVGVGRFVIGLYDDIEVVGDEGFKAYLYEKVQALAKTVQRPEDDNTKK